MNKNSWENHISPPGENTPPKIRISSKNKTKKNPKKREQISKNRQDIDPRRSNNPNNEKVKLYKSMLSKNSMDTNSKKTENPPYSHINRWQ